MTVTFQPSAVDAPMATGAQANYILDLQGMPKDDDNRPEAALAICEGLTKKNASLLIDSLKAEKNSPKVTVTTAAPKVEKGQWHCLGGKFYLVAKSQNGGHLYAKERLQAGGFGMGKGIFMKLSPATLVGPQHLDAIKAFGELHDRCVFCYLPLDLPESRTAGYGETCAANRGLPWG